MADKNPLKLVDLGAGQGQLKEFEAGDTLAVAHGGTGAADAAGARANLGAEAAIVAGTTTQYWRGDKTWRDFATDVRAAVLTGLSTTTNAVIDATDSVLAAFGKLQAQISAHFSTTSAHGVAGAVVGTTDTQTLTNKTISGGVANPATLQEGSVAAVVQSDIGPAPNQVPLNLHLGRMAYQSPEAVTIGGGAVDGTAVGASVPAPGAFTTLTAGASLGYAAGSGGAVAQATSRTTGVTIDKPNGAITLVSAAGSSAWQSFTVTNALVAATDVVSVCQKSGTDLYLVEVTAVAAGSFRISFATTGGTTTEQPVFSFAVIKAVTA